MTLASRVRSLLGRPWFGALGTVVLFVLFAGRVALLVLAARTGQVLNGYADDAISNGLLTCSYLLLFHAAVLTLMFAWRRRWIALLVSLASIAATFACTVSLAFSITYVHTKLPYATVHSRTRAVTFALVDEMLISDTGYHLASIPDGIWQPFWRLPYGTELLDYSESGELLGDYALLLSADEQVLAVSRGGQLTDAVDLEQGTNLVSRVVWNDPQRERHWAARTEQVRAILAQHGGVQQPSDPVPR